MAESGNKLPFNSKPTHKQRAELPEPSYERLDSGNGSGDERMAGQDEERAIAPVLAMDEQSRKMRFVEEQKQLKRTKTHFSLILRLGQEARKPGVSESCCALPLQQICA